MSALIVIFCILLFSAHTWLIFAHPFRIGQEKEDKSKDPLFTRNRMIFSFLYITVVLALNLYRRIWIELDFWHPQSFFERFLDFLPLPARSWTFLLGVFLFCIGFFIRLWAIKTLGRLFTFEIGIRKEHQIIDEGPYQWIRHPSYTGYLLVILGMGFCYASLFCIIGTFLPALGFLILRIHAEEKMLMKYFEPAYVDYSHRTKKLIPFIFILK